ncbi:MAG TPA: hypothetical protein DDW76_13315 [Cyanobacteria bacterium UBA11369]|nr:hypothetical protein [Cyanobacteria bacterium UBA11371]HBE32763.1 hypothetical protein [Cyanobacteria bacterium UBA11368]HBE49737.1 hypothetical protein [Cyanobacteria bacterium UBA11369]
MEDKVRKDKISLLLADREKISKALAQAVREALLRHKQAGNSVAAWRDGKIAWIPPEEIFTDKNNR